MGLNTSRSGGAETVWLRVRFRGSAEKSGTMAKIERYDIDASGPSTRRMN